jgi:hypothetical protein
METTTTNSGAGRITLADASLELSNLLIKLYKEKIFLRAGKNLADRFFECGLEGGALVASIPLLSDRALKLNSINQALLKLNEARYILRAMLSAEYYTATQVNYVLSYLDEIVKGLKQLLDSMPTSPRKVTVKTPAPTVIIQQKTTSEAVSQKSIQKNVNERAVKNGQIEDEDGFNDMVYVANMLYLNEYVPVEQAKEQ